MSGPTRLEVCVAACADAFRGDGEILASPMGPIPSLGARLARATFEPDLVLSDGMASLVTGDGAVEGWLPYAAVFDTLWWGRRHVMMGASQLDRYGNQNISCIGDHAQPAVQLLGSRGAPGNTVHHPVSYWVPRHSRRVFVERVDVVSGVGTDRASGGAGRFHDLRVVVSDLAVMDLGGQGAAMRLRSVHPGVSPSDVADATGFALEIPPDAPTTRLPTPGELELLRGTLDREGISRPEAGP